MHNIQRTSATKFTSASEHQHVILTP